MSENSDITGRQIAAGRILAGLGEEDLAGRANVSVATLGRIEAGDSASPELTNAVLAVRRALEAAGVEFTDGGQPGVRMRGRVRDGLSDGGDKAYEAASGWFGFVAWDGDRAIEIRASHRALDDLDPTTRRGSDYRGIVERNRERIFEVGRRLFECGIFERDGAVSIRVLSVAATPMSAPRSRLP